MRKFLDFLLRRKGVATKTPPGEAAKTTATKIAKMLSGKVVKTPSVDAPRLSMGFDFGTAFSKVVVRYPAQGWAYAVRFPGLADSSSPFLLPTSLYVNCDGVFSLDKNGTCLPGDIKYGLMTDAEAMVVGGRTIPYANACAAYLALVIRRAKESFAGEYKDSLPPGAPIWEAVNIGIPAATKSDNPRRRAFQRAANAALALLDGGGEITADSTDNKIQNTGSDNDRCLLIPEVAAQIHGYKTSDVGRAGLHIMADVGASTLDVCSFIILGNTLNAKQGDVTVFCAKVPQLGVRIIERRIANMPEGGDVEKVEKCFWRECEKAVREVVHETKQKKAPNESCWRKTRDRAGSKAPPDSLPFLLCGGGASMEGYKNMPEAARKALLTGGERFEVRQMPIPRDLKPARLPEVMYHRLSVAYGLSVRSFDSVVLPSDIRPGNDDLSPSEPSWKNNYVGKEQT